MKKKKKKVFFGSNHHRKNLILPRREKVWRLIVSHFNVIGAFADLHVEKNRGNEKSKLILFENYNLNQVH